MTAVKIGTGRRGVLRTFALTFATGAIGLASAGAKPAAAAVESALTPPGATLSNRIQVRPLFASNNDPLGRSRDRRRGAHIAEQSRSWRAASGVQEVMRGS